jgi:hypothetical protein
MYRHLAQLNGDRRRSLRFTGELVKSGAANSTPKLTAIIAGMAADTDSIDDLDLVRAGGAKKVFGGVYAAATLGIFLREFTHGHTRQLSAVLRRHLVALAQRTPVLAGIDRRVFIDIDPLRARCTAMPSRAPRSATPRSPARASCAPRSVPAGGHHRQACRVAADLGRPAVPVGPTGGMVRLRTN